MLKKSLKLEFRARNDNYPTTPSFYKKLLSGPINCIIAFTLTCLKLFQLNMFSGCPLAEDAKKKTKDFTLFFKVAPFSKSKVPCYMFSGI